MRDPLLIDSWKTEIPITQREQYKTINQNWDPLKSLTDAHDRIRELTRTNNQLVYRLNESIDRSAGAQKRLDRAQTELEDANKKVNRLQLQLWFMTLIVSPILAAIAKAIWSKVTQ